MQVVFLVWVLVLGMKDILWDGGLEQAPGAPVAAVPADSIPAGSDVSAAEGPDSPPPPKP